MNDEDKGYLVEMSDRESRQQGLKDKINAILWLHAPGTVSFNEAAVLAEALCEQILNGDVTVYEDHGAEDRGETAIVRENNCFRFALAELSAAVFAAEKALGRNPEPVTNPSPDTPGNDLLKRAECLFDELVMIRTDQAAREG